MSKRDWTYAATNRDRRRYPYAHALWRDDVRLIETIHGSLASLQIEVSVSKARIRRGDATEVWVDGVADSVWHGWPL
jgi:hypothetical protein